MVKDNKKNETKPRKSDFKAFLKKRAPIYLGIIALFVVFVVPELTKGNLQNSFPNDLTDDKKQAFDILMNYKGPNEKGLSVYDAISNKINEEYPNEKIFDNKKTQIDWLVSKINSSNYQIVLNFESYKGKINFSWEVNSKSSKILANDPESKHIIDLVNFYD
jgi:hypothetical protein